MKKRHGTSKIVLIAVLIFVIVVALYSGLRFLESTVLYKDVDVTEPTVSKTITRDGADYFPRQDITTILIMGIDEFGPVKDSMSYNNTGEADVVLLAVFDESDESYRILSLNRDTMVQLPILGLGGKQAGTRLGQLALAHTYGSGLHDSCENTRKAVSDFFGGIYIDYYLAMNMDAISILNDAVGGVTVTITEDLSSVDESLPAGRVTLMGEQALNFVRVRKDVGNQLNISRMERQKEYAINFVEAMKNKLESDDIFALSVYDSVSPYIVTDISVNTFSGFVQRFADYSLTDIVTPDGENIIGEQYYEFHVDQQKLKQLALDIFYKLK